MMLRVPFLPVLLAASVGLVVIPAAAPVLAQGRSSSDTQTQQSPYHGTVVEDIAARVNDQVISKSDYDRAEQELEQEARQQGWSQAQIMEQKRDLMRSLIDNQLLLSKGKELGINGETEVIKRLDDMRKQYHLASLEDLQKAAEAQGVSFEDLKEQIRENVIRSEVISQEVGSHIQVAPSEIRAYYDAHKQEFEKPEEERLSEILIPTANPDDAAQVAAAKKKAEEIEERLKGGADFATVAKADSGGPTAAQGGDLGEFKRDDLHSKELADATFDLPAGQYTQPIQTRQGWLILKVTEHQKGGEEPLNDVQNQIQEQIGMQKMEPALRDYLTKLRNEASIDVRAPYYDSGATPNEIKLVQSAYTPPQAKKKKHEERARYRQRPVRRQKQATETAAGGIPAGVPTLDKVNGQKESTKEVASNKGTEKPGKKEKIRFGQAPRETLPAGPTREIDAGAAGAETADGAQTGPQVAANQPDNGVALTNAQGEVIDTSAGNKTKKTRLSDLAREPKAKQRAIAESKKRQKFAPPPETQQQVATDQMQQSALGLNGDSKAAAKKAKAEKAKAAKNAPKKRMSDEDKKSQPSQQPNGTSTTGTQPETGAAAPQL